MTVFTDEQFDEIEKRDRAIFRGWQAAQRASEKRRAEAKAEAEAQALLDAQYPQPDRATPADITPEWVAYRIARDIDEWQEGYYREYDIHRAILRAIAADDSSPWQAVAKAALEHDRQ